MRLVIVTGLSGSGKSVAVRQLEDIGYYCIDNLPVQFISSVAKNLANTQKYVAFGVDSRSDLDKTLNTQALFEELQNQGWDVRVLFLTTSTSELIQRFSETRRRHPLTLRLSTPESEITLAEAIQTDRELMAPWANMAHVVDTTSLQSNTLRTWVKDFAQAPRTNMTLAFESFGFKHGLPSAADLVFDVRNLPNPYYDVQLRPFTGRDQPIIDYMLKQPSVTEMVDDIERFIEKWLPSYQATNRHYLTIAIGCTGGQHRSVYVAETLAKRFAAKMEGIAIRHRIIGQAKAPIKGMHQSH